MLPEPLNTLKKKPILSLYIAGAILLVVGGVLWAFKLSVTPERVFWKTLEQSLATSSVTVDAKQDQQNASIHQVQQYSLGAKNVSHTLSTVKQGGTTIVNELAGTPKGDYTRYVSVSTDQKTKEGKPLDFSDILGVWAKAPAGQSQLFSQAVLGAGLPIGGVAVPIGNLQPQDRQELLKKIRSNVVYQIDYDKVKSKRENGRLLYIYDVEVQAVAYANLMQQFAKKMGLHDLDTLNPADFRGQSATKMRLTIDVRAQHVVKAEMPSTGASQTYTAYDTTPRFTVPEKTISVEELQSRLSHLQ
jgi:hypothetical protein